MCSQQKKSARKLCGKRAHHRNNRQTVHIDYSISGKGIQMDRTDRDFIDYENARLAERWRILASLAKSYLIEAKTIKDAIIAMDKGDEEE